MLLSNNMQRNFRSRLDLALKHQHKKNENLFPKKLACRTGTAPVQNLKKYQNRRCTDGVHRHRTGTFGKFSAWLEFAWWKEISKRKIRAHQKAALDFRLMKFYLFWFFFLGYLQET